MDNSTDWSSQKERINHLYIVENKTLAEVRDIMKEQYGFVGTEQQYKKRFKTWGFDKKNSKDADMRVMLRKELKRTVEDGKESEFFLNEKQVPPHKMTRFAKRKGLDEEMIAASDMPTPSYITCHTPQPSDEGNVPSGDILAQSECDNDAEHETHTGFMALFEDQISAAERASFFHLFRFSDLSNYRHSMKIFAKPLLEGEYDSTISRSKAEQLVFAARITFFICSNQWHYIEAAIDLRYVSKDLLDELSPPPLFIDWAIDEFSGVPSQAIEFALFFILQLKSKILKISFGFNMPYVWSLFTVALRLSDWALNDNALTFPNLPFAAPGTSLAELTKSFDTLTQPTLRLLYLSPTSEGDFGGWSVWRSKLECFRWLLPPLFPTHTGLYHLYMLPMPFGPREPLKIQSWGLQDNIEPDESSTDVQLSEDRSLFTTTDIGPPEKIAGRESSLLSESLSGLAISESLKERQHYEALPALPKPLPPPRHVAASPFERLSARYHLSDSPGEYYRDIAKSNPLNRLSPIPFSTSSQHESARSHQYQRPSAGQLAMLISTPPLSESHGMKF